MAQFRATIEGQRGEASRLGSKQSGITATINGWDDGVSVRAFHRDGKDVFYVYRTAGSNGRTTSQLIATISNGTAVIEK